MTGAGDQRERDDRPWCYANLIALVFCHRLIAWMELVGARLTYPLPFSY
jgi:hypothetical protein